ncbi:MAG: NAD(P)H-hydrate dehydratase [Dehalococcoidia bacterium]|nr:NAD(P)H-hydrate dehydratase [Dehalococcoidia bacterium]
MKIVTTEQMQTLEKRATEQGVSSQMLMANAGRQVAREVGQILGKVAGSRILMLVGPGNNGGDGLVAARHLDEAGAQVSIYLLSPRSADDANYKKAIDRSIPVYEASADPSLTALDHLLASSDIVIDALFGTGKKRPLAGAAAAILSRVWKTRRSRPKMIIVALDLPSGLDPDTGSVDPACVRADVTITLAYPKLGLFAFPGSDYVGRLVVVDIGIPALLANDILTEVLTAEWVRALLPPRPRNANKGAFGKVIIAAGSINYIGAAYLACAAAARVGAGLVTLATAGSLQPILAAKLTETTYLPLDEAGPGIVSGEASRLTDHLSSYDVLVMGCGLGQHPETAQFVRDAVSSAPGRCKLVLDADALNNLSGTPAIWKKLPGDAILTPHPGEMSRLLGIPVEEVQENRLAVALRAAGTLNKVVVLKGAHTVIAGPDGRAMVSTVANPALASAGTGDVLAGAVGGLLAQGISPFEAAACAVYLHGAAAVALTAEIGDAGVVASDLLVQLPREIKRLKQLVHWVETPPVSF